MRNKFTQITDHLFRFSDTCNVYVVKDGNEGILIDAGSGSILNSLNQIGISRIDWILHTHHHRDQCWGDYKFLDRGSKIAVPEYERYLFEEAEEFWNQRRIYDNYNDRNTFFTVGKNIPVDALLKDYQNFPWHDYRFYILPAKGHTMGSSSLIAEIDGRKVAFTGDLLHGGGKIYQLHAMEYSYGDVAGFLFTNQSIEKLAAQKPDLCLPSHGPVIKDPDSCIKQLQSRIRRVVRLMCPDKEESLNEYLYPISEHLLWGGSMTCSNFYVIRSKTGKALFIDYGHSFPEHMHVGVDREEQELMRFIAHHLQELPQYGINKIDVVIPTHIHDDHTCGIPYLQKNEGAKCWTIEQMAPILEKPASWSSTPCCYHQSIRIDRKFRDGEKFSWEEYTFQIFHAPGQTEFHSLIATTIDNTDLAFTGDNMFQRPVATWAQNTQEQPIQTQVFRNSFQLGMHKKCQQIINELAPERICPGHGEPFDFDKLKAKRYYDYINRKEELFRELSPQPAEQNVDLFWVRLLPYQSCAREGEEKQFTLFLRNNLSQAHKFGARLIVPDGWQVGKDSDTIILSPGSSGKITLNVKISRDTVSNNTRELITAEIFIDGISQGPIPEALVKIQ